MKGTKFNETLKVTFKKVASYGITYKTAYFNSKAKIVTNVDELHQEFKTSQVELDITRFPLDYC